MFELMLILMFAHGRRCFHRYYCPTRSTDPDTYPCTDRAYFCPAGAASPTAVRSGYYSVQAADGGGTCPDGQLCSERECDAGHYCVSGVKYACPAGRWGNGTRLTSQQQCSLCPAGRYAQHSTRGISHVTPWFPHPCCVAGVAGWLASCGVDLQVRSNGGGAATLVSRFMRCGLVLSGWVCLCDRKGLPCGNMGRQRQCHADMCWVVCPWVC